MTIPSDEECISKCDVLHWAERIADAVQDEQNDSSVSTEMRGYAREVHREARAGPHCIPENGHEMPGDGTRD